MSTKHHVTTNFLGGMKFDSVVNGHSIILDAAADNNGNDEGPRPKALILTALMGCTGMDVASLLKKMHVEVERFSMECDADLSNEHPMVYTEIRLKYFFKVAENDHEKVEKAVLLSQEKYCGVSEMLKKICPVIWEIQYL